MRKNSLALFLVCLSLTTSLTAREESMEVMVLPASRISFYLCWSLPSNRDQINYTVVKALTR